MRLLLIEDNEADAFFFREALRDLVDAPELDVCARADVGLEHLNRSVLDDTLPDLIVLDLNLPRMSGLEMLARLRENSQLAPIPVIILSSSGALSDITACYQRGARAYLVKPMDLETLGEMVAAMVTFWGYVSRA